MQILLRIKGGSAWLVDGELVPFIAGGKGGSTVNVPGPTPEQVQAQQQQTALMKQQMEITNQMRREQQLVAPMMYKSMGYNPTYNEAGELTGLAQTPEMAAQQERQNQLQKGFQERQLAAMRGELPVDPGLMIDLQRQQQEHESMMAQQFGQGGQSSTGALQASDVFSARKNAILEGARRGDLTLAEQLGASSQMQQTALMQRAQSGAMQGPQYQSMLLGNMMNPAQVAGQVVNQGQNAQQMGMNATMASKQMGNQLNQQYIGMGAGFLGGLFSDRRLKKDIVKLADIYIPEKVGLYSYTKFGKPEFGVMADEVEKVRPDAVKTHASGFKLVDYARL